MKRVQAVLLIAVLGTLQLMAASKLTSVVAGRLAAERDVRAGRLILKSWGYPSPVFPIYAQLVHERYGIQITTVAGCVISSEQHAEWNAYNAVVAAEIERRFGADALNRVYEEAEKKFREMTTQKAAR